MLKIYNWLKLYWPAMALGLMMLAVIDATLSSLLSCHPISANPGAGAYSKPDQEECTALRGPIFLSLTWLLMGLHKYEGALLAIFTVVLAIFTGRLWYSTEKLSIATSNLVRGAEDTAQRQLRAYVGISRIEIRHFGFDKPPEGWARIKNFGNTPAYQLERRASLMFSPFPAPDFPEHDWSTKSAESNLPPGGKFDLAPIRLERALTSEETAGVVRGDAAIYFFGEIRYVDAFNQHRTTKFRQYFHGNGTAQYNTVNTIHDDEGNESD